MRHVHSQQTSSTSLRALVASSSTGKGVLPGPVRRFNSRHRGRWPRALLLHASAPTQHLPLGRARRGGQGGASTA